MIRRLKIGAFSVYYLIVNFFFSIRASLRTAYKMSYCRVHYGAYVQSGSVPIPLRLGNKAWVGKNVTIFPGVEIGAYTAINQNCLIESGTIGNFCSIAANVAIGMEEHPMHHLSTHVATYESTLFGLLTRSKQVHHRKPVPVIGNDVWIARGAIVLRGVTIGDGAVIGAGAVVTRDVPPFTVVAGNPAVVIRERFSKDRVAQIMAMQWWNRPEFYATAFEEHEVGVENFLDGN